MAGWLPGCVVAHLAVDAADTVFTCGPVFRVFRLAGGWWLVAGWLPGCVILYWLGTSTGARTARAFQHVPVFTHGPRSRGRHI